MTSQPPNDLDVIQSSNLFRTMQRKPDHLPKEIQESYPPAKLIDHACRELKLTRGDIGKKFGVHPAFISYEHIRELWLRYLRKQKI